MGDKKIVRALLPIKTSGGLEMQTAYEDDVRVPMRSGLMENSLTPCGEPDRQTECNRQSGASQNETVRVVSTAMLLSRRKHQLAEYKMKIGILSASFLEDPDNRVLRQLITFIIIFGSSFTPWFVLLYKAEKLG